MATASASELKPKSKSTLYLVILTLVAPGRVSGQTSRKLVNEWFELDRKSREVQMEGLSCDYLIPAKPLA